MLKEALVTVPKYDNAGQSLDHILDDVMLQMVDAFGGCTVIEAKGAWRGPDGKLYAEPVNQVMSAYEASGENDAMLRQIAVLAGEAGAQLAMYVRYASGNVEIIKIDAVTAKAA